MAAAATLQPMCPTVDLGGVEGAIRRMRDIEDELDTRDGVARFNAMYRAVTEAVRDELRDGRFEEPAFLSRLTVLFANLYLDAYEDAAGERREVPHAWAPLFDQRHRPGVTGVQFALAGMNAHINYDLGIAVVDTCRELGVEPESGTPHHADYLTMNAVLARVAEQVKEDLVTGLIGIADAALGRLDDVVSMWSVARARDAAWTHAETLTVLQPVPPVRDHYLLVLGRTVGLAGRGLLVPVL